jgi:hypothetical protein
MRLEQQNLAIPVGEKDFEEKLFVLRSRTLRACPGLKPAGVGGERLQERRLKWNVNLRKCDAMPLYPLLSGLAPPTR